MFRKAIIAAAALLATLPLASVGATPVGLTVKDGAGNTQVICGQVQSDTSIAECHVVVDSTGAKIDPATKQLQQSQLTTLGTPADPYSVATDTTAASAIALLKGEIYELKALFALMGSPAQAGGNVVITGALPGFATAPTVNLGTLGGAATAGGQTTGNASLVSILAALSPNVTYLGTTTPLAAAATYMGATRDSGSAPGTGTAFSYFNSLFYADQAGSAFIDGSNDGTIWFPVASAAFTASTPLTLTTPVMFRYHRARFVNGSTAQTTFAANSSYTAS